jgi:hypothetical protein
MIAALAQRPDDDQERRERAIAYIMRRDHVSRESASKALQRLNGPELWMLEQAMKPRVPMFVSDYDPLGR